MYAIFSAWKFYIKERGLLKKYLREYSGLEPSMMSTLELKENFQKVQTSKQMFGRQELSPIDSNNMSPQFTKAQFDEDEDLQATGYFSSMGSNRRYY